MRKTSRNTLVILVFYAVCAGGLLLWVERELNSALEDLGANTAEMVANQVKAALYQKVIDSSGLEKGDIEELREAIVVATERSNILSDIELVDRYGRVVASDDKKSSVELKKEYPLPKDTFSDSQESIVKTLPQLDHRARRFEIKVPIKQEDEYVAYLRLVMEYQPISELYDQIYSYFLIAALAGLFIVVGIGLLVEFQFAKFAKMLAQIIDNASEGEVDENDSAKAYDYSGVEAAAKRLGTKLQDARTVADLRKYELEKLTKILQVGVILQGEGRKLEFLSETAKELIAGSDMDRFNQDFQKVQNELDAQIEKIEKKQAVSGYVNITLSEHEIEKRLRCEIFPIDSHGWKGYLILVKDSLVLDALNEDLRAATRARNLARLYVGAAHDLKGPLNNMTMGLRVLRDSLSIKGELPKEGEAAIALGNLDKELVRLSRLITVLIDQAAPQAGKEREKIDVAEMIQSLSTLLSTQARVQKVEVEIHIVDSPVFVNGILNQIQQAILNIMINALDAMPKGGSLSISVAEEGACALISVCDTGPGIPTSLLPKIFEMHFTTRSTGTGIGLYVSRALIEQHGGEVKVKSDLGDGTCFDISLPLLQSEK